MFDCIHAPIDIFRDIFPPEPDNCPPLLIELCIHLAVPLHIATDLFYPKFTVTSALDLRKKRFFPILTMKELAVTEYCNFVLCEGDIWFPGESCIVFPIPVAFCPERFSKDDLDFGIL